MNKTSFLLKSDSKGKARIAIASLESAAENSFIIKRQSGLLTGKLINHPVILIDKGKSKRSVEEQAELQYNAIITQYLHKGYKLSESDPRTKNITVDLVPTDSSGFAKHMLAKPAKDVPADTIEKHCWYVSRKIDGVRCSFYYKDGKILSASRGGKNYDFATSHIRENKFLLSYFEKHPNLILDGELYVHGKTLQQISGCVRLTSGVLPFKVQYYVYDIMEDKPFNERLQDLGLLEKDLNLPAFDSERTYEESNLPIQILPHVYVEGQNKAKSIWKLHDLYVSEGFEGCVARDEESAYKNGARDSRMIKFKNYRDDCFKVVGKEGGLRGAEDMVFICELPDGRTFKAKPFGDKACKEEYWNNFETKYKGHIGECKFFYMSDDGIPLQPNFRAFRWDLENENK